MKFVIVTVIALLMAGASAPAPVCIVPKGIGAACTISPMTEGRLRFDCLGRDGKLYTMIHAGEA
jgi:hypothetical protein